MVQTYCFDQSVLYREIPVRDNVAIDAYFEFYNPKNKPIIVIPDGALDLLFLWNQPHPEVYLGGTALKGRYRLIPIQGKAFGVRMKPGIVLDCFRDSLAEIVDSAICLNEVRPFDIMLEKMVHCNSIGNQIKIFQTLFPTWAKIGLHPITTFLLDRLDHFSDTDTLDTIIAETGYSHVHVNRVFKMETGYSLKFFLDTLRIQKAIYCLRYKRIRNMQQFSTSMGFYDQAHFSKSFKLYTCYTPKNFYKIFGSSIK